MLKTFNSTASRKSAAPVEEDELNYEDVSSISKNQSEGRTAIALYDYQGGV